MMHAKDQYVNHEGVNAVTFDDGASTVASSPNNQNVVGAVLHKTATIICIVIPLLLICPCTIPLAYA